MREKRVLDIKCVFRFYVRPRLIQVLMQSFYISCLILTKDETCRHISVKLTKAHGNQSNLPG
jgi:hypothetical protein